jgi:hypothetical protein
MLHIDLLEVKTNSTTKLLRSWLCARVSPEALIWLDQKCEQIANTTSPSVFFTAFSAAPRHTGKHNLNLTNQDLEAACSIVKNWFPTEWSVDQIARALLALSLPHENAENYLYVLEQVFNAADVGELVALYQALPLLHYPERLQKRAAEGVRSCMTVVFNAVALRNPYPSQYFDDGSWNQMVLKALFVGSPINQIQGLSQRVNPELTQMLKDYISERQAAKRSVAPEIFEVLNNLKSIHLPRVKI